MAWSDVKDFLYFFTVYLYSGLWYVSGMEKSTMLLNLQRSAAVSAIGWISSTFAFEIPNVQV